MEEVAELKTLEHATKSHSEPKGEQTERSENISYELMLIFLSDLGEEGINKELDELKKHISSDGGEIFNEDTWGNREMAYRIKKQDKGFYCILNFKIGPDHIAEMQRNLTISPAVIRFLLTKTPVDYVFKTFEEYQALAEKEKELKETAKREESRTGRPPAGKQVPSVDRHGPSTSKTYKPKVEKTAIAHEEKKAPVKAEIKEVVTHEEKEEEKKTEKKPRKTTSESSGKTKLEEVDAKLKSIIDNPDITL